MCFYMLFQNKIILANSANSCGTLYRKTFPTEPFRMWKRFLVSDRFSLIHKIN